MGASKRGSLTLCFFFAWPKGGGGVLSLARGCCVWPVGLAPGKKRSIYQQGLTKRLPSFIDRGVAEY